MQRREFLKGIGSLTSAAAVATGGRSVAKPIQKQGVLVEGVHPASIVALEDGRLVTPAGRESVDGGRTWSPSETFTSPLRQDGKGGYLMGMLRLPDGELGAFYADNTEAYAVAVGNATNHWRFKWSSEEGGRFSGLARSVLNPAFRPGSVEVSSSGGPFKGLLERRLQPWGP